MNVIKLFSISQSMASITRYSQLHLVKPESVLEHTGFVCLFSYLLAEEMNSKCEDKIDIGTLLKKAVVHDMDEVVTGDIPRPTKYFNKEATAAFEKIAKNGMSQIIEELDIGHLPDKSRDVLFSNWLNSKAGPEGSVLALSDLAAVVFKIWDEVVLLGNKKLVLQGSQVHGYINDFEVSLKSNDGLSSDQKSTMGHAIKQLQEICRTVEAIKDPMLGTLSSLQEEKKAFPSER